MKLLFAFISTYFISSLAFAQIYNSSVTSATAGSGRAATDIGEASFLNPATLVHQPNRQILISEAKDELAIALSENSKDVIFPGSLGYVQRKLNSPLDAVMHDMRVTLAENIARNISFGLTGHYYQVTDSNDLYKQINIDMGLLYNPRPDWGLAVVAYDMVGGREEMPVAYRLTQKTGVGANWLYRQTMRVRLDAVSAPNNNFSKMTGMLGFENYYNRWIVGRVGYQDDTLTEKKSASLGFGVDLPKFSINYAFLSELPRNANERHSIDLGIKF